MQGDHEFEWAVSARFLDRPKVLMFAVHGLGEKRPQVLAARREFRALMKRVEKRLRT